MNNDATEKIAMLKDSLRCFVCGLFALVPVIGIPFGVSALVITNRVRRRERKYWNAAKPYRVWGTICAVAGIFLGLGVFALFAIATYNALFVDD